MALASPLEGGRDNSSSSGPLGDRARGIGWWGAAIPDTVPLLAALVAGQRWSLRWERGSRGSLSWEGLSNGKSRILSEPF